MAASTTQTSPLPPPHHRTLRIGTRASTLALAQVSLFTALLPSSLPTSTHPFSTQLGDTNKTTNLHTLASTGKSLWTEDLEVELLEGRVDVLVHSLKDVPTKLPQGCKVRAVGGRGGDGGKREGRDCVVLAEKYRGGGGLGGLRKIPSPARVGTSSIRRAAMLRRCLPGVEIIDCRGNVGTRLRKLDQPTELEGRELGYDALVLAGAGVQRLGLEGRIDGWLDWGDGVGHAVGQGLVGVEWREGDQWVEGMLEALEQDGGRARWEGEAERALLRVLEGGCSVPVGVDCRWEEGEGGGEGGWG
ncbi:MAG: porphobilinogen deaminase [Ramalina farinacea]|uniref:hydroxymethylbilane synthase n=1 Tax=Ramalina farinacea TaxID=258253 RepID=A0AA43QMN0_9LECA|nr:porphobilinogen deaminase [Ramalina farinacea]